MEEKVYDNLKEYSKLRDAVQAGKVEIIPNAGVPNPPTVKPAEPMGEIRNAPNLWNRILERSGIVTDPQAWKKSPIGSTLQTGLGVAGAPFTAPAELIDTAAEAMGRQRPVSPSISTPGGTPSMSLGEMAANAYPARGIVKRMGNPILEKIAPQVMKALPPGRFKAAEMVPEFRTASGLEGPARPVRRMPEAPPAPAPKPTIRMTTKQAEESVAPRKPFGKGPRRGKVITKPVEAPKEDFDVFLKDSINTVDPATLQQLKAVYATKGKDAAIDMAIDLAAQGKLTVR